MSIPSYKEIYDLMKKGATFEAQEKIMELREKIFELQDHNLALKEEVRTLSNQLSELQNFDGEVCPSCKKNGWYIKSSKKDDVFGELGGSRRVYECKYCSFTEEKLITD